MPMWSRLLNSFSGFVAAWFLIGCERANDREFETSEGGADFGERVFPENDWESISPRDAGMSSRRLEKAVEWFEERTVEGDGVEELLILRGGRIVWAGEEIDRVHGVWSMTKTFTSSLMGTLIDEGLCGLDDPVSELIPELSETYPGVTYRHLLTMTSGYEAEGDWPPENPNYVNGGSRTPFVPSDEAQFMPGEMFSYWDSAFNLTALAMVRLTGKPLDVLFSERIARPIGMNSDAWRWAPLLTDNGIAVHAGSGNKGKHIEISAREAARFGLLMLRRGRWNDRQILSERWVDLATSPQVSAETPLGGPIVDRYGKKFPFDGRGCYGFAWWTNGSTPGGDFLWPDLPRETFMAWGYHNNFIFVVPEWDLVVVRFGQDARSSGRLRQPAFNEFLKMIGESIRS